MAQQRDVRGGQLLLPQGRSGGQLVGLLGLLGGLLRRLLDWGVFLVGDGSSHDRLLGVRVRVLVFLPQAVRGLAVLEVHVVVALKEGGVDLLGLVNDPLSVGEDLLGVDRRGARLGARAGALLRACLLARFLARFSLLHGAVGEQLFLLVGQGFDRGKCSHFFWAVKKYSVCCIFVQMRI